MKPFTLQDQACWSSKTHRTQIRVEIEDANGIMQDFMDLDGFCYISSVTVSEDIGNPFPVCDIGFYWCKDYWNMSPFSTGSKYSGYVDSGRIVNVYTKTYPDGTSSEDIPFTILHQFTIDEYDIAEPEGKITCRCKLGALLMDTFIPKASLYGNDNGSEDVEDVVSGLLTDHILVPPSHTFVTPTNFQVKKFAQQKMTLYQAIQNVVQQIGWDMRIHNIVGTQNFQIVFYEPDRNVVSGSQYEIQPQNIHKVNRFASSITAVRNFVTVWYGSVANVDEIGNELRSNVVAQDAVSIAKYGKRAVDLALGATSLIQDPVDATSFANFVLQDLSDPSLGITAELTHYFHPAQINDYYTFKASGKQWTEDADLAIEGYAHTFQPGNAYTTLKARGNPSLDIDSWIDRSGGGGRYTVDYDVFPEAPVANATDLTLGGMVDVVMPNYFDVKIVGLWRSTTTGFTPSFANFVTAIAGRKFILKDLKGGGPYYCRVAAFNEDDQRSLYSNEVQYTPDLIDISDIDSPLDLNQTIVDEFEIRTSIPIGTQTVLANEEFHMEPKSLVFAKPSSVWDNTDFYFTMQRNGFFSFEISAVAEFESLSTEFAVGLRRYDGTNWVALKEGSSTSIITASGKDPTAALTTLVKLDAGDQVAAYCTELSGATLSLVQQNFSYRTESVI